MAKKFKRVVLKLSGEALREPGSQDNISPEIVEAIAEQIKIGQQQGIEYGNGVWTEYAYDELTFRLVNLTTRRASGANPLQDLSYTYDPTGNITAIRDDAQQTIFFNNQVVTPSAEYEYDALYRLVSATGREHSGQNANTQRDHTDLPYGRIPR